MQLNALQRLRRHGRVAVIALACSALAVAISAGLVQRSESSATESGHSRQPIAVSLEPYPEGPVFTIARGEQQWSDLSLPSVLPAPVTQACGLGSNVVLTLGDGSRTEYGPCTRPPVIELLRADLLSVAHGEDLRASVAPECARRILSDWFDNARIDRLHRHVCYEKSLELLPEGFADDLGAAEATIRTAFTAIYGRESPAQVTSSGHPTDGLPSSLAGLCLPNADRPPCGSGVRRGIDYEHLLYTHCGVESTIFDGRLWLAQPPLYDRGVRGAPPGWSDPTQGGVMRLLGNRAEFRADALVASFAPAPPGYAREACD